MFEKLQELVGEINAYDGGYENVIKWDMGTFWEIVGDMTPEDVALKIHHGDFNPNHEYGGFNGYANFVSSYAYEYEEELLNYGDEIISEALDRNIIDEEESQELLEELGGQSNARILS